MLLHLFLHLFPLRFFSSSSFIIDLCLPSTFIHLFLLLSDYLLTFFCVASFGNLKRFCSDGPFSVARLFFIPYLYSCFTQSVWTSGDIFLVQKELLPLLDKETEHTLFFLTPDPTTSTYIAHVFTMRAEIYVFGKVL
jgi:hypothetical protein